MTIALVLTMLLGSPQFEVRIAAESSLATLGPLATPSLTAACRSNDPEIASRAARLLDLAMASQADWLLAAGVPYIDGMPGYESGRYHAYITLAVEHGFAPVAANDWPAYRQATRLWLADELASGVVRDWPVLLAEMRVRSARWDQTRKWE